MPRFHRSLCAATVAICKHAHGTPAELKVYPPFTPTTLRENSAPGHALFSFQGVKIWGPDLLDFLARHLPAPIP